MPAPRRNVLKPPTRRIRRGSRLLRPAQITPPSAPGVAASADASGLPNQGHLFYGVNSARWWLVWVDPSSDTTLRVAWSTDCITWTDSGTSITLAHSVKGGTGTERGRNVGVTYKNIASTDVVHVFTGWNNVGGNDGLDDLRFTCGAGTISVTHSSTQIAAFATATHNFAHGNAGGTAADSRVYSAGGLNGINLGDAGEWRSDNADAGSSWTRAWTGNRSLSTAAACASGGIADLGGSAALAVYDNGAGTNASKDIGSSKWTGTWSANAAALAAPTTAAFQYSEWGAVGRTTTDVHLVVRDPDTANAYLHRRYNGTTWGAGASVPTQASKAGAGAFLCTDGTDVWLFVIDSDAANTVRYVKWSNGAGTWGTWTAFETSTQVRTGISGSPIAGSSKLGICWTEVASPFLVVTKPLSISAAASGASNGHGHTSSSATGIKAASTTSAGHVRAQGTATGIKNAYTPTATQAHGSTSATASKNKSDVAATQAHVSSQDIARKGTLATGSTSAHAASAASATHGGQGAGVTSAHSTTTATGVKGAAGVGSTSAHSSPGSTGTQGAPSARYAITEARPSSTATGVKGGVSPAQTQTHSQAVATARKNASNLASTHGHSQSASTVRKNGQGSGVTLAHSSTSVTGVIAFPQRFGWTVAHAVTTAIGRKNATSTGVTQTHASTQETGTKKTTGSSQATAHSQTLVSGLHHGRGASAAHAHTNTTAEAVTGTAPIVRTPTGVVVSGGSQGLRSLGPSGLATDTNETGLSGTGLGGLKRG